MMNVVRILLVIIGVIFVVSFLQFIVNIHPPKIVSKRTPLDYQMEYENVSFKTSDGITIKGWLIKSPKANGTIIVGHGYPFDKGNILPIATFLHPQYNLLYYDHRYFGESEGKITTAGFKEAKDVEAAVKFVRNRYGRKSIGLYGFSLSAAAMLRADVKVKAIVSDSTYADAGRMVDRVFFMFGPLKFPFVWVTNIIAKVTFGVYPSEISPANAIKEKKIPIFVIHGDKDSQIPVDNAYLLKESNSDIELWIVEGADHGMAHAMHAKEYEKRVKDFFKKNLKSNS